MGSSIVAFHSFHGFGFKDKVKLEKDEFEEKASFIFTQNLSSYYETLSITMSLSLKRSACRLN